MLCRKFELIPIKIGFLKKFLKLLKNQSTQLLLPAISCKTTNINCIFLSFPCSVCLSLSLSLPLSLPPSLSPSLSLSPPLSLSPSLSLPLSLSLSLSLTCSHVVAITILTITIHLYIESYKNYNNYLLFFCGF